MKLKLKACGTITLDSGEIVQVERIGKGRFSTAWRSGETVYLKTSDADYSKEIMSVLAEDSPRNRHLPECKFLSHDDGQFKWYVMPFYKPLTAKNKQAWDDFKALSKVSEEHNSYKAEAADIRQNFQDEVLASNFSQEIKDAVVQLCDAAANYGDYSIEIARRNCAVDTDGNLILLDPLFDLAFIRQSRKGR